jgi:hypothetical protein
VNVTDIPKPDDLLLDYLRDFLGPWGVVAVGVFALFLAAKAWIDAFLVGGRVAGRVGCIVQSLAAAGFSTTAGAVAAADLTGVILATWVVLADLLANFAGRVLVPSVTGEGPLPDVGAGDLLRWPPPDDPLSQYVFWNGVFIAVVSLAAGVKGRSAKTVVKIVMMPWLIEAGLIGIVAVIANIEALINWNAGRRRNGHTRPGRKPWIDTKSGTSQAVVLSRARWG